jgi:diacylglycerol kinase
MSQTHPLPKRTWKRKFHDAGRGILVAIRGHSSFTVHLVTAAAVVGLAVVLKVSRVELCVLALCITLVMTAELLNTSLEQLAKALGPEFCPHIRDGLDISSGAVLAASIGSVIIGMVVFWPHVMQLWTTGWR